MSPQTQRLRCLEQSISPSRHFYETKIIADGRKSHAHALKLFL